MISKVILASNSKIRAEILRKHNFEVEQIPSGVDEEEVKLALVKNKATCLQIAKNLAELKACKISSKFPSEVVIGADQVLEFNKENIDKPKNKNEAKKILAKLNNNEHTLQSAVCVARNGSMISHFDDTAKLKMKALSEKEIDDYLDNMDQNVLRSYGVYQIEAQGRKLFEEINGDEESILGMPIDKLKPYLHSLV